MPLRFSGLGEPPESVDLFSGRQQSRAMSTTESNSSVETVQVMTWEGKHRRSSVELERLQDLGGDFGIRSVHRKPYLWTVTLRVCV